MEAKHKAHWFEKNNFDTRAKKSYEKMSLKRNCNLNSEMGLARRKIVQLGLEL